MGTKKVRETPWLEPFKEWLRELSKEDPEAAARPRQHEKAFAAGWNAARKPKKQNNKS